MLLQNQPVREAGKEADAIAAVMPKPPTQHARITGQGAVPAEGSMQLHVF
jgi:hypothetical protein